VAAKSVLTTELKWDTLRPAQAHVPWYVRVLFAYREVRGIDVTTEAAE